MNNAQRDHRAAQKSPRVVELVGPVSAEKTTAKRPAGQHKTKNLRLGEE
jgi:hypothetical protein